MIDVIEGIIDETEYDQLLNRTWFGVKTPLTFAVCQNKIYKLQNAKETDYKMIERMN
jgi:hypothetical protein